MLQLQTLQNKYIKVVYYLIFKQFSLVNIVAMLGLTSLSSVVMRAIAQKQNTNVYLDEGAMSGTRGGAEFARN